MADSSTHSTEYNDEFRPELERSQGISVAFERCPLCSSRNVPFYCHNCVNKGVFTHTKPKPDRDQDRFVDVKNRVAKQKTLNWELRQREVTDESLKAALRCQEKQNEIKERKARLELLRAAIKQTKESVTQENDKLRELNKLKVKKMKHREDCKTRHGERKEILRKARVKITETQRKTEKLLAEVQKTRKQLADLIMKFFCIRKTNSLGDSSTWQMSRTSALVQDACQTAYHRGKWMFNDSNEYLRYSIADIQMPANGNYTECLVTMAQWRENLSNVPQRNAYHEAINALGYTAVAVNALSWVLDIPLPRRQSHSEFWLQTLDEKQLENAIARLNHNVLYLCFSQGVEVVRLSPKLTLHNILMLMEMPNLGRSQVFEVVDEMLLSLGESTSGDDSEAETEEGSVGSLLEEEEDWSIVPTEPVMPTDLSQVDMGMPPAQGGLVSSMAQSAHAAHSALISSVSGVFFRFFDGRNRSDSS